MTEPTRLRDGGPDAVRALLRHAPPTRSMTVEERDHSRARVARAAAGLAAGAGTLAILQGAAIGAGLGLLTVGAAQVVPALLSPRPSTAPVAPAPVRPPLPFQAPVAPLRDPPSSASAAPDPPSPRPAVRPPSSAAEAPSAPAPASGDTLAEEVALLEKARAALASTPAQALALADAHAARFPAGKLATEREMVAIDALVRQGRAPEARARAAPLRGSLYEERLQKLLAAPPP